MEAVPRMPMIWLDLKEAGEFGFQQAVKKFVLKNYGENPENYNEELKKLEQLRQNAVNVPRDFEGCSILRKYFGQLHYLQSRIPMGAEHEAAVPITWTEIFSGKTVTHEDIKYEQACILYNLGALHSMLGAMDKRVSEEGMKVSCTHFQCAAGAFAYLRDHFPHSYSVDMSHQILNLNINLMLGQAQECLLEKSMLDNRKSFLVARISAQVVDYYKEACRALENSETASLLGKIQKDWKKLVQMKIYYFAAVAHLHMGKQAEEQQKYGERVSLFASKVLGWGQPETVQEALRFTMDVIGGKYNSAKKENDFIYHEAVPALDTLQSVKGAPLVKALPVNPTDPAVTGPDIFAKLVPMAAHEASSLYSEEKAKLLREVMAKIDAKNEVLEQFMDSLQLDPETVDNLDMYNHIPPVLMEKCAALSVRPETVKNLVQSMQVLSGVFTDVEASLKEIKDLLDEDDAQEQKLREALGGKLPPQQGSPPTPPSSGLAEVAKEWAKYMEVHEKASFTNTELHKAMNLHISNLRLLSGPLEQVRAALPTPSLTEDDQQAMQTLKRILAKVQEMKDQRVSLEQQLREMIQKDDITTSLVTTDRSEMKKLFEEQLKKYDQIKVYLEQNLTAQENILKALTDANVKYAAVRKVLAEVEHKWNTSLQTLVASYEAYEDLMKKSQEGKDFYADLESKVAKLLEKSRAACKGAEVARQQLLERELKKRPPARPTTPKPALQKTTSNLELPDPLPLGSLSLADLPEELRSLPPEVLGAHLAQLPPDALAALGAPQRHYPPPRLPASSAQAPYPPVSHQMPPSAPQAAPPPMSSAPSSAPYPPSANVMRGPATQPAYPLPPQHTSPQHLPMPVSAPPGGMAPRSLPTPVWRWRLPAGVRPATTTVDSIQAPISSCAAPRGTPNAQFPYPQPCGPPFMQQVPPPYSSAQPPQAFSPTGPSSPRWTGRSALSPSARPPQQYTPQFLAQAQMPQQQPAFQHPFPAQVCAPQAVLGQGHPVQLGAQHYQLGPAHDKPASGPPAAPSPVTRFHPALACRIAGPGCLWRWPDSPGPWDLPDPSRCPYAPGRAAPARQPGPPAPRPSRTQPGPGTVARRSSGNSSTDDLLSSSPESQHGGAKASVGHPLLQPTKADAKDGLKPKAVQLIEKDPYEKPEHIRRLLSELERFQDVVGGLEKPAPSSGSASELDGVWKELQDAQEKDARQLSIAIARCYSMKNRHQDIMPYDKNRIVLQSGKDDYINASRVEDLSSYCPTIIATQAPLVGTASDFWLMIYEQKVSVVVMLVSEQEIEKQKVVRYFPTERGQPMVHGLLTLVLTSVKATPTHVERMITLQFRDQSLKRTVIHLQFSSWPELGLPDSKGDLLRFIQEVHSHYLHQRPLHTPIVVHCSSGVGRTGAFCLLYAAMQEVEAGNSIPDLPQLVKKIRQQRKHMLQEKLHLKFCYESLLKHAKLVLQRHGVTAPSASKPDPQDLVLGADMPISSIQATIAKLSIRPPLGGAEPSSANGQQPEPLPLAVPAPPAGPPQTNSNHLEEESQEESEVPPAPPGAEPSAAPATAPSSSSLELLASLTPEAFTLDSSLKGRHKVSKQSFLHPQNGEGLRGTRPSDDPLSMLDPLWTLNKT
uniref:Tyrosine-protein phosphatase non-receptor type 23 n=1 Tax=Podarcis muralis TaxID=64176 RepID=A0A670JKQ2_PODMU